MYFFFSTSAKQTKQTSPNKPHLYVMAILWNIGSRVVCTCVWSVLTSSVKIFPYRPPAQLIRANYRPCTQLSSVFTIYTDLFVKGICISVQIPVGQHNAEMYFHWKQLYRDQRHKLLALLSHQSGH